MNQLALHPVTKSKIDTFARHPAHAVLLIGPKGSGKYSIARYIAEIILPTKTIETYPYIHHIEPTKNTIPIDAIREIDAFVSLKVPGSHPIKRVVIIESADSMGTEAQNALLKNLEEPPLDTIFILTATKAKNMLPTILSRVQTIVVGQPSKDALKNEFPAVDSNQFSRAYLMSGGNSGTLTALLDTADHILVTAADYARKILSTSTYERLAMIDEIVKIADMPSLLTEMLGQMAHVSLLQSNGTAYTKWLHILEESYTAHIALQENAHAKLVLTNLMLQL